MSKNRTIVTVKRFICLTLVVLLLSESPSWDAIAAEPVTASAEENAQTDTGSGTWTELTDRRTENAKWYTDSAGNLKVTVYDTAVHVETDDGWQEADWFEEALAAGSTAEYTEGNVSGDADSQDKTVDSMTEPPASENIVVEAEDSDSENTIVGNAETAEGSENTDRQNSASGQDAADTGTGIAAYKAAEYTVGYDTEGSEVYTYIDIPEEYLVMEGYTLYGAKINFADTIFTGYSEEAESLTVGIFLGDGQEDETEDTADTGIGESIREDTAAIDTEATEIIDTEIIDPEAAEANDTEEGSVEEGSWETRTIRTSLSGLIDLSEDSTGPVSFTLNTGTLSAYITEDAQLIFGASMGSGLVTATTTDSQSGTPVPLWECIFVPSETTDDTTGEDYYLVDGSINTDSIDGGSEEPRIIGEIEEKRDSNTKYFLTEGGGEIAAVYPEPVHYQENGEWLDIDNTLELKKENGEERYHNKNSGVEVSFAATSTDRQLVIIDDGNTTISWGLAVAGCTGILI